MRGVLFDLRQSEEGRKSPALKSRATEALSHHGAIEAVARLSRGEGLDSRCAGKRRIPKAWWASFDLLLLKKAEIPGSEEPGYKSQEPGYRSLESTTKRSNL